MKKIISFEQFREIKNKAIVERNLKNTNFLIKDSEMALHILAGQARYEEREDCLLVVINYHDTDWVYFWLDKPYAAFLPKGIKKPMLAFFGFEEQPVIWDDIAYGLSLRMSCTIKYIKVNVGDVVWPDLSSEFVLTEHNNIDYDYYAKLCKAHFILTIDGIPPKEIWDEYKKDLVLIEARCKNGELAGFLGLHHTKKKRNFVAMAVFPKFRGKQLASILFHKGMEGNDGVLSFWVHAKNSKALKIYYKLGFVYSGKYRKFYCMP